MNLAELWQDTMAIFRPPTRETVSQWADKNRILSMEASNESGRWRTDRAPYQREMMDAFNDPRIHEIAAISSAQVGKTEILLNMIGYAIDSDPGPMMLVEPKEEAAEDYSKRRIAPMIEACPTLKRKVRAAKGRDSQNTIRNKSFPGGSLSVVSAQSPNDLKSKPIRFLFMEELDGYPETTIEGDPVELAEKRTETYENNKKIVKISTPNIKGKSKIEKAYMNGTQEEWQTECPHCKKYSFIRFNDILFEKEEIRDDEGNIDYVVRNARWKCPLCEKETGESDTKRLPAKWVAHNEKAIENGIRSFRINPFMSPWSNWRLKALKFLRAKDDPEKLHTFYNPFLGESWEISRINTVPAELYRRREPYRAEVPAGVLVLTLGVDTQDNRLEYEVVGWDRDEQSWGIEYGVIMGRADTLEPWQEIDDLLDREWRNPAGARLRIGAGFVDSGGHFTSDVYRECAKREVRKLYAIKGEYKDGRPLCRFMKETLNGGDARVIINVSLGKEAVLYNTTITEDGPKKCHWPDNDDRGYTERYFLGLISEEQILKRSRGKVTLEWNQIYDRNEPLDIRNYARACYKFIRWNFDKHEITARGDKLPEKITTRKEIEKKKNKHVISRGISI